VLRAAARLGGGRRPERISAGGHSQRDHAVPAAEPLVEVNRVDSDGEDRDVSAPIGGKPTRPEQAERTEHDQSEGKQSPSHRHRGAQKSRVVCNSREAVGVI